MREADADTRAETLSRTQKAHRGTVGETRSARPTRTARGEPSGHEALPLIEQVVRRENLVAAHARVVRNGGAPGVDGMTVDDLMSYCRQHWARLREHLLSGTYVPHPVRRVEIPKPDGKGVRMLGIPTVLDRFIQQALLQVLSPLIDPTFSDASYGFRPGRSTHQAVQRAREHIAADARLGGLLSVSGRQGELRGSGPVASSETALHHVAAVEAATHPAP